MLTSLIDIQIFGMFLLVAWILENINDFFLERNRSKRRFRELEQKSKQAKLLCEAHASRLHLERLYDEHAQINFAKNQAGKLLSEHLTVLKKIGSRRKLSPDEASYVQLCSCLYDQLQTLPDIPPSFLE
jgi:hypothetical protein